MSAESILSNLLQEEKHRLGTNSQQKSKLLAAISYIEKLENENRQLRAKTHSGIKIGDIDVRELARIGFEAHWAEYPEDQRPKWDGDDEHLIPWLSAAIAIRSHCIPGGVAIRKLENLASQGVDVELISTAKDHGSHGFRLSLDSIYGNPSSNLLTAIESALDFRDSTIAEYES